MLHLLVRGALRLGRADPTRRLHRPHRSLQLLLSLRVALALDAVARTAKVHVCTGMVHTIWSWASTDAAARCRARAAFRADRCASAAAADTPVANELGATTAGRLPVAAWERPRLGTSQGDVG